MRVLVARLPRPNVEQPLEIADGARVMDVLRALSVPSDSVVVLRDDAPLAADAPVLDGERLRVVSVFSGG